MPRDIVCPMGYGALLCTDHRLPEDDPNYEFDMSFDDAVDEKMVCIRNDYKDELEPLYWSKAAEIERLKRKLRRRR